MLLCAAILGCETFPLRSLVRGAGGTLSLLQWSTRAVIAVAPLALNVIETHPAAPVVKIMFAILSAAPAVKILLAPIMVSAMTVMKIGTEFVCCCVGVF